MKLPYYDYLPSVSYTATTTSVTFLTPLNSLGSRCRHYEKCDKPLSNLAIIMKPLMQQPAFLREPDRGKTMNCIFIHSGILHQCTLQNIPSRWRQISLYPHSFAQTPSYLPNQPPLPSLISLPAILIPYDLNPESRFPLSLPISSPVPKSSSIYHSRYSLVRECPHKYAKKLQVVAREWVRARAQSCTHEICASWSVRK